jgi:hypothetical protein
MEGAHAKPSSCRGLVAPVLVRRVARRGGGADAAGERGGARWVPEGGAGIVVGERLEVVVEASFYLIVVLVVGVEGGAAAQAGAVVRGQLRGRQRAGHGAEG